MNEPTATATPPAPAAGARAWPWLRRHAWKLLVGAVLLLVAAQFGPRWLLGPQVLVDSVVQRDFVQTLVASGRVETPHRVDVGVQVTGTVRRVPVAEGQAVVAGQVLIELDSSEASAAWAQAERAVQQAQARLRQLRELQAPVAEQALREAELNHDAASRALLRSRELRVQGFIGQAALDEAQRAEQVAQAQVRVARQQLDSARPAGSDTALAQAALAQAEAAALAARARLGYATVRAPAAGTLITRNVEPGAVVQTGKVLMVLSPTGETQLVVPIDERNLRLLQLGQQALASADAYPLERFAAELAYINPGVDAQRGAVEVKLRVPQPPRTLMQDMTVSVDIEVARRAQAVLAPTASVHDAEAAAPWVLKLDGHHARRQAVKLGLRSNGWVEVLQGLQPGDQLVPATAVGVTDGQRLRPRQPASGAAQ
jgi:HlyD family secretion protein